MLARRASTSAAFLRRLREDDQTRGIGDALLDQRNVAGIGNIWKAEGCFLRRDRPVAAASRDVSDDEALAVVRAVAPADAGSRPTGGLRRAAPGSTTAPGCPAARCETPIRARGQGDDNRTTYWCPACQALIRVGHKGADHVAPGNTVESFEAALEHGVDMIEFDVLRTARRPAGAGPRLRGRRPARAASRSTRGSTTSPGEAYAASSSTWT